MSINTFNTLNYSFSAIGEARNNWEASRNNALISNNHWSLPNGTHYTTDIGVPKGIHNSSGMKIVKGNGYIRYEDPNTGHYKVITDDGMISTGC
jgi:hypothetical protein